MSAWLIKRDGDRYNAHREFDCGFAMTIFLYVNSPSRKTGTYTWSTYLFRDTRDGGYQMQLGAGRARTANEAKRCAHHVAKQLVNNLVKNVM